MIKKRTNCPNCGAPIIHSYNYNCEYCKTFLEVADNRQYTENKELSGINVYVEKMYREHAILITITGILVEKFRKCYEYDEFYGNFCYQSDISPKKIGFNIKIPFAKLRGIHEYNVYELYDMINSHIPPEFSQHKYIIFRDLMPRLQQILK